LNSNYYQKEKGRLLWELVKMKLNRNMSDDTAAKVCIVAAGFMLAVGIFLFIFGAIQGTA